MTNEVGVESVKKILLLGGSRFALPVIKAAHELGHYVITCDYLPDNIAHKYSDEYCNVSIIEKEEVLEVAKKHKIDGIMSFACDPGVVTAAYVADRLGLPNVGPYESVCILQNKGRFRKFLADNGFTVPTAKGYMSVNDVMKDTGMFNWPVIVKPTDSAGSKGVTRVDKLDGLGAAAEHAMKFSHCGQFIVEDFIEKKGFSSDTDSFSVNGELKFVSFNSQRFDEKAENPYTPAAYSWPSSMSEMRQKELALEIQRLLCLLDMGTSVYNIETREGIDGKVYIMEVSPRGGGNRLSECLRYATGVDLITNAVRGALGEEVIGVEQKDYDGCWAEVILHSDKPGVFDSLWIDESISESVYECDLWVESGKKVGGFSAANEAIGTLVLKFDSQTRLKEVMANLSQYVKILLC